MASSVDIRVPGRVWEDAIRYSNLETTLSLVPQIHSRGRGFTVRYFNVPLESAYELGEYLQDRALSLSGQAGLTERDRELARTMSRTGTAIVSNCKLHEGREG